jgi:hypothetical protein
MRRPEKPANKNLIAQKNEFGINFYHTPTSLIEKLKL